MIKITVIIPTCERSETLYHCIKTCLNQDYANYELLISNNASTDNTDDVISSFNDSRIRYIKTDEKLSMSEHWEFALSHVKDGYVMIIGDDDGLIPNSLNYMDKLVRQYNVEAITVPQIWIFIGMVIFTIKKIKVIF